MCPSSTALFRRQGDPERRSTVGTGFHRHGTAVQNGDFAHERKPQPHAAHFAASGFINSEKRLEDAVPVFRRDACSRIGDVQNRHGRLLMDGDGDGAAGAVVLDGVFNQIEQEAVAYAGNC